MCSRVKVVRKRSLRLRASNAKRVHSTSLQSGHSQSERTDPTKPWRTRSIRCGCRPHALGLRDDPGTRGAWYKPSGPSPEGPPLSFTFSSRGRHQNPSCIKARCREEEGSWQTDGHADLRRWIGRSSARLQAWADGPRTKREQPTNSPPKRRERPDARAAKSSARTASTWLQSVARAASREEVATEQVL